MDFKLESLGDIKRQVTITVPWEELEAREQDKFKDYATRVNLDGFRKGKAPLRIIKQQFGASVRQDVMTEIINKHYADFLEKEHVEAASLPQIDVKEFKEGEPFNFIAVFEVFPEIKLTDIEHEKISKTIAKVSDEDVALAIKKIQKQHIVWQDTENASKVGDRVTIDYEGLIDNIPFEGGSAKDASLIIGSHQFLADFEKNLVNLKTGDEHTFEVTFPEDYHNKDYANKEAKFTIKLNKLEVPILPELDTQFVKKYGIESGVFADLQNEIRNGMERELKEVLKNKTKQITFQKLLEKNDFPIPAVFIEKEVDRLIKERNEYLSQYAKKKINFEFPRNLFEEQARQNVKLGLLLPELIKKYDIQKNDEHIRQLVEEKASAYENPEDIIRQMYASKDFLRHMEALDIEEQIVEKLLENAMIEEEEKTYLEVMDRNKLDVEEGI